LIKLDLKCSNEIQIVEIRFEIGQIVKIMFKLLKLSQTIIINLVALMKLDSNCSNEAQIVKIRLEVGQIIEIMLKLLKLLQLG